MIDDNKIDAKIELVDSYLGKSEWNERAREYLYFIRRNDTSKVQGNYDFPAVEVTGIRNIIDDVVNSLSLYVWRGNEKMFEIVSKEDDKVMYTDISDEIQNKINEPKANFVPTLQKVIRDWMEYGMGSCMYIDEKKKGLFFKSINPINLSISFDSYQRPDEFFYKSQYRKLKEFGEGFDNIDLLYHWKKEEREWEYKEYEKKEEDENYSEINKSSESNQSIFVVRYNTTSDCMLAKGKGLLMLDTLKLINNIYESLCDVASQKLNKVVLMDEKTAMSLNQLGQTFNNQHMKIDLPLATVRNEQGNLLTVLDNNATPQLAQWLFELTSAVIQQTFSINRLLSVQQKQMTATEVSHRADLDQKYIDFATQTFKNEFLDVLVRNLMMKYRKDFAENIDDLKISWLDNNNKVLVNERLQEINVAIDILSKLKTFGQQFQIDTTEAEQEIISKTNFSSLASTSQPATGEFIRSLQQNLMQTGGDDV